MKRIIVPALQFINFCLAIVWFSLFPFTKNIILASFGAAALLAAELFLLYKANLKLERTRKYKTNFKKLGYELNVAASQISAVSNNLAATLDENNAFSQQMYAQSEEMKNYNKRVSETIENTITLIRQVILGLQDIQQSTGSLKEISISCDSVISVSLAEILHILKAIKDIQKSSNDTIAYMSGLNDSAQEIKKILDTVSNISEQIHILAVNASIESSRAGQAGRGFAVVSSEIRNLASSTSEAVNEIGQIFDKIQAQLNSVNSQLNINSENVEVGVSKSKIIEKNLGDIQLSFSKMLGNISNISALTNQQVSVASNVSDIIVSVEDIISKADESVDCVCRSIGKQKDNVAYMSQMGGNLSDANNILNILIEDNNFDKLASQKNNSIEKYLNKFKSIAADLNANSSFAALDKDRRTRLLTELKNKYDFIQAIWTNDKSGKFIVSLPPAGIVNGNIREWFKKAVNGEFFESQPYISAITRTPCITLSAPIKNAAGEIAGVIGIDIEIAD